MSGRPILCPTCPMCEEPPGVIVPMLGLVLCATETCPVLTWDIFRSWADNRRMVSVWRSPERGTDE